LNPDQGAAGSVKKSVSKVVNDVVAIKVSMGMLNWLDTANSRSASNRSRWALDSQIETTWKPWSELPAASAIRPSIGPS
jgi:hypothetical protein